MKKNNEKKEKNLIVLVAAIVLVCGITAFGAVTISRMVKAGKEEVSSKTVSEVDDTDDATEVVVKDNANGTLANAGSGNEANGKSGIGSANSNSANGKSGVSDGSDNGKSDTKGNANAGKDNANKDKATTEASEPVTGGNSTTEAPEPVTEAPTEAPEPVTEAPTEEPTTRKPKPTEEPTTERATEKPTEEPTTRKPKPTEEPTEEPTTERATEHKHEWILFDEYDEGKNEEHYYCDTCGADITGVSAREHMSTGCECGGWSSKWIFVKTGRHVKEYWCECGADKIVEK